MQKKRVFMDFGGFEDEDDLSEEKQGLGDLNFKNDQRKQKQMKKNERIYGIFGEDDEDQDSGEEELKDFRKLKSDLKNKGGKLRKGEQVLEQDEEEEEDVQDYGISSQIYSRHKLNYGNFRSSGVIVNQKQDKKVQIKSGLKGKEVPLKNLKRQLKDLDDLDDLGDFSGQEEFELSAQQQRKKRLFELVLKKGLLQESIEIQEQKVLEETRILLDGGVEVVGRSENSYEQNREQRQEEKENRKRYGKGLEILKKFGWSGGGLGKNQDGIQKPVEAVFKSSLGEGGGKSDKKEFQKRKQNLESKEKSDLEEKQEQEKLKIKEIWDLWRGEQIEEVEWEEVKVAKYEIENGIQNGLDACVQQVFLILEKIEKEIEGERETVERERDEIVLEEYEIKQNKEKVAMMVEEEEQLERIWVELSEMDRLEIQEMQSKFKRIFLENKKVFLRLRMETLFTKLFVEKFKKSFEAWTPGIKTDSLVDSFKKSISFVESVLLEREESRFEDLEKKEQKKEQKISEKRLENISEDSLKFLKRFKDYVVQKAVLPPIRNYFYTQWHPLDSNTDNLIDFLDQWSQFIPEQIQEQIMAQLVIPQLISFLEQFSLEQKLRSEQEIFQTEKQKQTISLHLWLHPWLLVPQSGIREKIWPEVVKKFSLFFSKTEILNENVLEEFVPWLQVFTTEQIQQIVFRSALPKILFLARDVFINPADQKIEEIEKILLINKWNQEFQQRIDDSLKQDKIAIIEIVYSEIFDKIQQILTLWMNNPQHDKNEIKIWLQGWVQILPAFVKVIPLFDTQIHSFYQSIQ